MGQSNEISQISTRHISVTTETIFMKLKTKNYLSIATYHAKLYLDPTVWVLWANTQFATVWILCLSFVWFLSHAHRSHQWTDFDDLYVMRRVSMHGCALWRLHWYCCPFSGLNCPKHQFWGMNGHFPAKHAKYSNLYITKTTGWITNKFWQMIKTSKYS